MVDSGAARSFFPKDYATDIGLSDSDLEEDVGGAEGVEGQPFPTWSSTKPVRGQIIRVDPTTQKQEPWGPVFNMNPAFAEKPASLLGRNDFFGEFTVGFEVAPDGSRLFIVSY